MGQTLTRILIHLVFSTKHRQPTIPEALEPDLYAHIGGICRNHTCPLLAAGGTADHIHLLTCLPTTVTVGDLLLNIKRDSSKWMNSRVDTTFRWQEGYAAFSVGRSQLDAVRRYLSRQKEHHKHTTFKEELVELLRRYGIEYDERYIWT